MWIAAAPRWAVPCKRNMYNDKSLIYIFLFFYDDCQKKYLLLINILRILKGDQPRAM